MAARSMEQMHSATVQSATAVFQPPILFGRGVCGPRSPSSAAYAS